MMQFLTPHIMIHLFNCSQSVLYTYAQTEEQLNNNTQFYIRIYNITEVLSVFVSTAYSIFTPSLNNSFCETGEVCTLAIQSNCPNPVSFFSYFDIVSVNIQNLNSLSFNLICNSSFITNTFEWGLFIQIVFCTFLITASSYYSAAQSFGGSGIQINIPFVICFNLVILLGGIISYFSLQASYATVIALCWIFGTFFVGICANELLWTIKSSTLRIGFQFKGFKFRIMQLISLLVGVGVCCAWWFTNKNFLLNDLIFTCFVVGGIKILKFTSFKISIISFVVNITVQIIFIAALTINNDNSSYSTVVLNDLNNPLIIQLPTINAVYGQKCSWIQITSILFPGILLSYMRRFDSSRNAKVYMITSLLIFFFGSLLWMILSVFSPVALPFGVIAEPLILLLIPFFAWKRKEIKTLWTGNFYDEEFANKESLNRLNELVRDERRSSIQYEKQLFQGLQVGEEESGIEVLSEKNQKKEQI